MAIIMKTSSIKQSTAKRGPIKCNISFAIVFLSIAFELMASVAYSDTHKIVNPDGLFDKITHCSGYDIFLKGELPEATSGCDEMTTFLINHSQDSLHLFVSEYHKQFPEESNFELLLYALKTVRQNSSTAYHFLGIAKKLIFGQAYFKIRDVERAGVYSVLIERLTRKILSAELPPNSRFIKDMPVTDLVARIGIEFKVFSGEKPYVELVCLLKADNMRVPVRVIAISPRLRKCIEMENSGEK